MRVMRIRLAIMLAMGLPSHNAFGEGDDQREEAAEEEAAAEEQAKPARKKAAPEARPEAEAEAAAKAPPASERRATGVSTEAPARVTGSAELLGAAPLDRENRDLFGAGGGGSLGGEAYLHPMLGIHAGLTFFALAASEGMSSTKWLAGHAGPRLHLGALVFGEATRHDLWADLHVTYGSSGGIRRPGFDAGAAVQWEVSPSLRLGPALRYQFGSDPRDRHAQVFTAGLAVGFGGRTRIERLREADRDGDGLADSGDRCPDQPAGDQPDPERAGCPAAVSDDADEDGIADAADGCPSQPAGKRVDPSRPGCPFLDRDKDQIADRYDRCPDEAGPPNPFEPARHGCGELARVAGNKIEILQQVFFETDSAAIKSESYPVLEAVAKILKGLGTAQVRIEGHTDDQGSSQYNLDLSKRRARAVALWLVQSGGIDAARLQTEGYGKERPLVSGADVDRGLNRRVEFVILEK
jgi:outer membrane protein OmpA-like peptidoglycan-associated protein